MSNDVAGAKAEYICIDPEQEQWVYDYMDGLLADEKAREFERHLLLCFKCQETIETWDTIAEILPMETIRRLEAQDTAQTSGRAGVLAAKAKAAQSS